MRKLLALLSLVVLVVACAKPRVLTAIHEGRLQIGSERAEVVAAAGPPDLVLASRGAETFFYRVREQAALFTMVGGKVVAFTDAGPWPREAWEATDAASKPVGTGKVRVGMTEAELRAAMGKPDGITAKEGLETFHWLTGSKVDSVVHLRDGVVTGFWDRPVSKFTQNLPTADRSKSTTNGQIRVGMTQAEVEKLLGKPDGVEAKGSLTTHKYETNPVFGNHILYGVGYRDGRVVNLHEFNVTRDEDEKDEAEAQREAQLAAQRAEEAEASMASVWSNPLVQAALGAAVGAASGGGNAGGGTTIRESKVQSSDERTLTINGTTYRGSGPAFGSRCSLDAPCPSGYTCALITKDSGACVQ